MLFPKILSFFLFSAVYGSEERPRVQTPLGVTEGSIKTSFRGRKFASFESIPYAKPPIGDQRFEPPTPIEPWYGIWNATHTTECPQANLANLSQTFGKEDCLHINVYIPRENPNSEENLDVIVHIHGGSFMVGSGQFYSHPEVLMDEDVIFVTFNYRLGILGFLSTEDDVLPGNNGLKDQVLALKWVQKNIASFGGNPNSVTITGLSAGGSSVHFHYFSEMSKGLFQRGISNSGVAINCWSLQKGALSKTKILADAVGCPTTGTDVLVACLKERPYLHLLTKSNLFHAFGILPFAPFAPVVEKGPNAFLKSHPVDLLKKGQVLDVPWILSNTANEGFIPTFDNEFLTLENNWNSLGPIVLEFNHTVDKSQWKGVSQKIKHKYFGENKISKKTSEIFFEMFGDREFLVDSEIAVKLHADAVTSPVYYYYFAYPGDEGIKFVSHGADAKYLFGPSMFKPQPLTDNELKMRSILVKMLISYAKTGTPIVPVEWKPTKGEKLTYLHIDNFNKNGFNLKTVEEMSPVKFWKSLGILENENPFAVKDEL